MGVLVSQSCLTLCNPMWPARLLCLWNSPGNNTGVGSHSLLQRIFLTQGLNLGRTLQKILYTVWATGHPLCPLFSRSFFPVTFCSYWNRCILQIKIGNQSNKWSSAHFVLSSFTAVALFLAARLHIPLSLFCHPDFQKTNPFSVTQAHGAVWSHRQF